MTRGSVLGVAVLASVLAGVFVLANLSGLDKSDEEPGVPYVRLYDHPEDRLEVVVNQGDGQAFAALAQDPLLRRPEIFRAGAPEAAYRAQRPVVGWLALGLSFGQGELVPLALVLLSMVGFVALGAAVAWQLERMGVSPLWAFAVLVTPGALVTLDWTGPECLGTAVALIGFGLWRDGRYRPALIPLVVAALCRESLLLVPLALAAHALVIERRRVRAVLPLGLPFLAYATWVGVVWLRLDALPSDAGRGRLALPFTGILDAVGAWSLADLAFAAILVLAGVLAVVIGNKDPAGWAAGSFLLASLVFGAEVWARVEDFSRVLLPVVAFAVIVVVPHRMAARYGTSSSPPTSAEVRHAG
jgi:hypothetical protein